MSKLWQFVNSPIIVTVIAVVAVFGLMGFGIIRMVSKFGDDPKQRNQIEALGRLQLISFAESDVSTNAPQKYIGKIRNNSSFIVHDVEAAICVYDAENKLTDVISRKLCGIGSIGPEQEREFYVERIYDWDGRADHLKIQGTRTTIAFVAAEVTKTEK